MSTRRRAARFVVAGAAAAAVQIAILSLLTHAGWTPLPADAVAFLIAAQVNFVLGAILTWRDRWLPASLPGRWLAFHLVIASTAGLNLLTFELARQFFPTEPAALLGVGVAGIANFFLGDRLVFRRTSPSDPPGCSGHVLARMPGLRRGAP